MFHSMASQDDKLQQQFGKNIYQQSIVDRETNAQWILKTNVLLNSKNQINLGL